MLKGRYITGPLIDCKIKPISLYIIISFMRYLKIAFLFCCLPVFAHAQEILSPPEATFITHFPFKQYSGGVMIVKAKFDGIPDSLNFILDTGSGGISLDSMTCVEFNIPTKATDTTITGIGGIKKVNFVFNESLSFPGLKVNRLNFHVNNYEVLTSVYGEKIDGILGYSFFSRYIVKINFDSMHVEVFTPGIIPYDDGGTLLRPVFTSLPIQELQIRDKRRLAHNFYFDTGAGLCFLMSDRFAADSAILLSKRKPKLTQVEGMAGKLQMRLTIIKEVKLGPYRFRRVPTYLYKDDYNVTAYPFSGGLIGNELLRRFNMTFNYGQREIHLKPNSHFDDPFDYSYSGMGVYYVDDKIIIEDVIKDSPADDAGLKVGDEIISVDNNISYNIQVYKNLLQVPDKKIKLIVRRGKDFLTFTLKTVTIL
jgi:hypothetical protein